MQFSMKGKKIKSFTKKEIILVTVLTIIICGYLILNYLLLPKWEKYKLTKESLEVTEMKYINMKSDYAKLQQFKDEENGLKYKVVKLVGQIPTYISQEETILKLSEYAKKNNISVEAVNLENEESVILQNFVKSKEEIKDGKVIENPESTTNQTQDNRGEPLVITKYVELNFVGKVDDLYTFIDDLEKNEKEIVVKKILIGKNEKSNLVGNMRLQYLAYKEAQDKVDYKIEVPNINGKSSPFVDGAGDGKSYSNSEGANFLFLFNYYKGEVPKFVMGESDKTETEIYNSTNGKIKGNLTIKKEGDKYVYTYSLGTSASQGKNYITLKNGKIEMYVLSMARADAEDKTEITMDVVNKTEARLDITVVNDDKSKPRFKLGNRAGNVYLKQVSK